MKNSTNTTLDRLIEIKNEILVLEQDIRISQLALETLRNIGMPKKSSFFGLIKNSDYEHLMARIELCYTTLNEAPKKINALQAEYDLTLATMK